MSIAEQYAREVLAPGNEKKTGRLIKLAAQRFLNDLKREDIYFDEVEAVKMVNFGERYCYQWEGDWEGVLVKFEPWQRFIFEQVYGWIRKDNGRRRFEEVYIQIAKKNGKSTMCAILMDFHLFADDRIKTPKIFTAANNEDQAKIAVNMAGRIIEASPELSEYLDSGEVAVMNYKENITEVVHYEKNGFIKAFSKETSDKKSKTAGGKHGVNASLGVVDEFGMSPDHGSSKAIKTSMASRKERLMFYITTAGFNMDGPCFRELRKVGIEVLEGTVIKDNYLPIIFEIDKPVAEDGKEGAITPQWLLANEWSWGQSNPNIDVSVDREFLRGMLQDAVSYGGTTEVDVKTLNFNEWCEAPEVWVSKDTWDKNTHGLTEDDLIGLECFGSIHIISQKELGAFCLFFPHVKPNVHAVKMLFWMPSQNVLNDNGQHDFSKWVDGKFITTCVGNAVDNLFIFDTIWTEISKYELHSISFPTNMEKHDIVQGFILNEIQCNPINQGYRGISEPTYAWEALLTAGQIEHFNNPVLSWTNSQCMVKRNGDDVKMERAGARTAGIVACINALAQWKTIEAEGRDEAGIDMIDL